MMIPGWVYTTFDCVYSVHIASKEGFVCQGFRDYYYLIMRDSIAVSWVTYTVGDPVPANAKVIAMLGGVPVYVGKVTTMQYR